MPKNKAKVTYYISQSWYTIRVGAVLAEIEGYHELLNDRREAEKFMYIIPSVKQI